MNAEIEHLIQLEKALGTNYVEQSLGYQPVDNSYNLTETEFLVLRMLVSNGQALIQQHLYNGTSPTELESLLCSYLDAALEKLPREDTTETVFRVTSNNTITVQDIGKEKVIPAYLTTSKKWLITNDNCVYVIRLAGRTKAKSIYKAYEVIPLMPEEQVEFPRNTKFFVADVCNKEGKTVVELWEQPDNPWPAEKLTNNVTAFFQNINTIDIQDAVNKGLNPNIHLMRSMNGKSINSLCTEKGNVYISPVFAQALWNLCYAGLWLSDYRIISEEFAEKGYTLDVVCADIDKANCVEPECLYLKAIQGAYKWEDMLLQTVFLLTDQYNKNDDIFLGFINTEGELEKRVNGLFQTGMGCILLHELMHYYGDHFARLASENRRDLEQEADDKAFDAILALEGNIRKSAILGVMASYLLLFYMNPKLVVNDEYYREDERLFAQYDKIDDKRRASIFVANVLTEWLKRYHNINVEVKHGQEEETVEEIRSILRGI